MPTRPFRHPARPAPRFRPIKAWGHFRKLVANKEDTEQVFHMSDCLPSRSFAKIMTAWCATDAAKKLMETEPFLPDLLDDHDRLLAMPQGSVAHAYVAFMRKEGLSAQGLVEESLKADRTRYDDEVQWFYDRTRDTHDLIHVLTSYGRDALGEQCALGFSHGQYRGMVDGFLAWAGSFEIWRRVKADAPVFAAVRQSIRSGRGAERLFAQSITDLLAEPIDAARARMRIPGPSRYQDAHTAYRAVGIDPYRFADGPALA